MRHPHGADQRPSKGQGVPTETQREVFRKALRRAREARGLSKRGLALKVGVTQSAVWQWEEGRVAPRPETAATLERVLGLDPGRLSKLLGYLPATDRKSTRLNSSHVRISYAVFCLKK